MTDRSVQYLQGIAWVTLFRARCHLRFIDIVSCRLLWEAEDAVLNKHPLDLSNVKGLLCS